MQLGISAARGASPSNTAGHRCFVTFSDAEARRPVLKKPLLHMCSSNASGASPGIPLSAAKGSQTQPPRCPSAPPRAASTRPPCPGALSLARAPGRISPWLPKAVNLKKHARSSKRNKQASGITNAAEVAARKSHVSACYRPVLSSKVLGLRDSLLKRSGATSTYQNLEAPQAHQRDA